MVSSDPKLGFGVAIFSLVYRSLIIHKAHILDYCMQWVNQSINKLVNLA